MKPKFAKNINWNECFYLIFLLYFVYNILDVIRFGIQKILFIDLCKLDFFWDLGKLFNA